MTRDDNPPLVPPQSLLTEDDVKTAVKTALEDRGFTVNVAWGHARGVDIEARSDAEHLYIEAKGDAPTPQMQGNYFLGALGELLQRMSDPEAEYGLALPDNNRYRGLVRRLPDLVVDRLHLHTFFVSVSSDDRWQVAWYAWNTPGGPP
jgi:hypothetical protein